MSGSGTSYTVSSPGIAGDGTLGISIVGGTATDLVGNTAAASAASQTFTVDNTAPTVAIGGPSATFSTSGPVTYPVTFSDTNFDSSDLTAALVTLNRTGGEWIGERHGEWDQLHR